MIRKEVRVSLLIDGKMKGKLGKLNLEDKEGANQLI